MDGNLKSEVSFNAGITSGKSGDDGDPNNILLRRLVEAQCYSNIERRREGEGEEEGQWCFIFYLSF